MEEVEEEVSLLSQLANIEIGRRDKRPLCSRCSRPEGVCWCRGLGGGRLPVRSSVVVLQHPHEEKRCLRTAPILSACLPQDRYLELRGKRFSLARYPELAPILSSGRTILMYPGEGAVGVEELPAVEGDQLPYNIVILDGTWQQAKSIYHNCPSLHNVPQVCLSGKYTSEYVIRTQPTEDALSTVETAAFALAILEKNWGLYDTLVQPLRLLCQYQIKHGAVPHQSKEQMIVTGRCHKPLGKRTYKKLRKCGARHCDTLASLVVGAAVDTSTATGNGCGDGSVAGRESSDETLVVGGMSGGASVEIKQDYGNEVEVGKNVCEDGGVGVVREGKEGVREELGGIKIGNTALREEKEGFREEDMGVRVGKTPVGKGNEEEEEEVNDFLKRTTKRTLLPLDREREINALRHGNPDSRHTRGSDGGEIIGDGERKSALEERGEGVSGGEEGVRGGVKVKRNFSSHVSWELRLCVCVCVCVCVIKCSVGNKIVWTSVIIITIIIIITITLEGR